MAASEFDHLAAMQALEATGVERKHAEVHAAQLRTVANADLGRLASKFDLDSLRREMRYGMGIMSAVNLAILGKVFGAL